MLRKMFLIAGCSLMTFQLQASPLACIVEKEHVFNGLSFERSELHEKSSSFSKGAVGTMFTIDLATNQFRGQTLKHHTYESSNDGTVYQLISDINKALPVAVITVKKNPFNEAEMIFVISEGTTTYTGRCQK
ncbi:TPA: hypothetical protein ACVU4T_000792 [Vibrio parahaemolyticus]|uniref:hypothetical protein n=2 Tax=Vibrio harveyi group TaxID=717610 RepID=UPI0035C6E411|nr:hypothetical protein [Vibrio parahaemolyticus]HCG7391545.1 hypothetical protein [Vibrio parahaemolyticus]